MARGRHRARPDRRLGRAVMCALFVALALGAATLSSVTDSERLLRLAALAGLIAVLALALLLVASPTAAPQAADELRRLRRELAELHGELAAYAATADPLRRDPILALPPLVPAALRIPPQSPRGPGLSIDLNQRTVARG